MSIATHQTLGFWPNCNLTCNLNKANSVPSFEIGRFAYKNRKNRRSGLALLMSNPSNKTIFLLLHHKCALINDNQGWVVLSLNIVVQAYTFNVFMACYTDDVKIFLKKENDRTVNVSLNAKVWISCSFVTIER